MGEVVNGVAVRSLVVDIEPHGVPAFSGDYLRASAARWLRLRLGGLATSLSVFDLNWQGQTLYPSSPQFDLVHPNHDHEDTRLSIGLRITVRLGHRLFILICRRLVQATDVVAAVEMNELYFVSTDWPPYFLIPTQAYGLASIFCSYMRHLFDSPAQPSRCFPLDRHEGPPLV